MHTSVDLVPSPRQGGVQGRYTNAPKSVQWESNPHNHLGKVVGYRYITDAYSTNATASLHSTRPTCSWILSEIREATDQSRPRDCECPVNPVLRLVAMVQRKERESNPQGLAPRLDSNQVQSPIC